MKVKDVMSHTVTIIPAECNISEAAEQMKKHNIGTVIVGDKENVVGIITDRDITIRVTAEGLDPRHTRVADVMTSRPFRTFDDEDLEDACLYMQDMRVRRLIVLNRQRDVIGVLSLDDVAAKTGKTKLAGYVLSKVATT